MDTEEGEATVKEVWMELESELAAATQPEKRRGKRKRAAAWEGTEKAETEFMWFREELWRLDVIHSALSRGIHLPPSCNYGALFSLLIHLNVCLCLFLVTIRAHT